MESNADCPVCHTRVRVGDYFCFNCGANLKPKPPLTDPAHLILLFLGSFFLPPMGIIRGIRYISQPDERSKIIGAAAVVITIISIIITILITVNLINNLNNQIDQGLQGAGGIY